MMTKKATPPVSPTLIYQLGVETKFGIKDIELYWGSTHSLMTADSRVIVSSTIFNSTDLMPVGAAWRGVLNELNPTDQLEPKRGLVADPRSIIWPVSRQLGDKIAHSEGKLIYPYISIINQINTSAKNTPRDIVCVHTYPTGHKRGGYAAQEDYQHMMKALLSQLVLLETQDALSQSTPCTEVILSTLAGTQGEEIGKVMRDLIEGVRFWSHQLHHVRRYRIAFWDKDFQSQFDVSSDENSLHEQVTQRLRDVLLSELNEEVQQTRPEYIELMVHEIKSLINMHIIKFDETTLLEELNALNHSLARPDWTIREVGSVAGRLSEALTFDLEWRLFERKSSDFFKSIEYITNTPLPKQLDLDVSKLSMWFKSYLHTLRVLRNASAHPRMELKCFPVQIVDDDIWMLLGSLHRVLQVNIQLVDYINNNKIESE